MILLTRMIDLILMNFIIIIFEDFVHALLVLFQNIYIINWY